MTCSLHRKKKEITKKVYNNIISSINLEKCINTIFKSSKNNKTPDPRRLLLNLSDNVNLKRNNR